MSSKVAVSNKAAVSSKVAVSNKAAVSSKVAVSSKAAVSSKVAHVAAIGWRGQQFAAHYLLRTAYCLLLTSSTCYLLPVTCSLRTCLLERQRRLWTSASHPPTAGGTWKYKKIKQSCSAKCNV